MKISKEEFERLQECERACKQLVYAYEQGELNGGSIDWENIDLAYSIALEAKGPSE